MKATGIELSADRHNAGCMALSALRLDEEKHVAPLGDSAELVHGSFFDYDFTDADVIFTDSVEFSEEMMERLAAIGHGLRPGALIVTDKDFPGTMYEQVAQARMLSTWGGDSPMSFKVLRKVGQSRPASDLPASSAAAE